MSHGSSVTSSSTTASSGSSGGSSGGISSTGKLRQFVCIEYPGLVENVDSMISTLGGIEKISQVYCEDNRRMELRFRPNDVYCKPTCGERHNSTALLLRVVRKKMRKKKSGENGNQASSTQNAVSGNPVSLEPPCLAPNLRTELVGVVHTTYKFSSLCDFQYLPLVMSEDGQRRVCVYDQLVPHGMERADWLNQPAPLYLPPAAFTRMDTPQDYRYRRDRNDDAKTKVPQNIIARTRQRRTHFAIFHSFKDDEVPKEPLPGALSQVRIKFLDTSSYQSVKWEFEKRPIWSKNALRVRLDYKKDKLKYLLPTMSYYFHTGPWRNLWVRLGYDPRKDPKAWIYQTFDFRIRQSGGMKTKVEAKRSYSNYILPYKSANTSRKKTSVIQSLHLGESGEDGGEESSGADKNVEELYIFRPGMIPPYRQMFYQYCDIQVPEIQKLLEEAILTGANKVCSEKYGWLPAGVEATCRDIMSLLIENTLLERTAVQGEELGEEELELRSNSESDSPTEGNSTEEEQGE